LNKCNYSNNKKLSMINMIFKSNINNNHSDNHNKLFLSIHHNKFLLIKTRINFLLDQRELYNKLVIIYLIVVVTLINQVKIHLKDQLMQWDLRNLNKISKSQWLIERITLTWYQSTVELHRTQDQLVFWIMKHIQVYKKLI
jgi:hypothetical protein